MVLTMPGWSGNFNLFPSAISAFWGIFGIFLNHFRSSGVPGHGRPRGAPTGRNAAAGQLRIRAGGGGRPWTVSGDSKALREPG